MPQHTPQGQAKNKKKSTSLLDFLTPQFSGVRESKSIIQGAVTKAAKAKKKK